MFKEPRGSLPFSAQSAHSISKFPWNIFTETKELLRRWIDDQYVHGNTFDNTGHQGKISNSTQHAHSPGVITGSPQSDNVKETQIKNSVQHDLVSVKMAVTDMTEGSKCG